MGTKATLTSLDNGKKKLKSPSTTVARQRKRIELSTFPALRQKLDMKKDGTAQVKIETKTTQKKPSTAGKAKLASIP